MTPLSVRLNAMTNATFEYHLIIEDIISHSAIIKFERSKYMKLYKFKLSDVAVLVVLFLAGYFFTITQKYYIPGAIRVYTYLAMVAIMYSLIFALIAPKKPVELANSLAVIFGALVVVIIIVQDIMIKYQLSWRTPIIFLAVVVIPYLAMWVYKGKR